MAMLLRIDLETLPRTLILDPPVSDEEFEMLCRENRHARLERTKEGTVRMNPPAGGWTSNRNADIVSQLWNWWVKHERGMVFDSSGGFHLPDGSILNPDASYFTEERLKTLPKGEPKGFARLCPDFVIELLSESDTLKDSQAKMEDWIANGVQLAWLIDPYQKRAFVYRPDKAPETVTASELQGEGPVAGFVLNLARVWKREEN